MGMSLMLLFARIARREVLHLVKRRAPGSCPEHLRRTRFLSKLSPPHLRSSGPFLDVSSRVHCTSEGEFGALVMETDSAIQRLGISSWSAEVGVI
jgi:hypothetical protein